MTNVDQFESVFRSADKPVFSYDPVEIGSVLIVTDRDEYEAELFGERVAGFLRVLIGETDVALPSSWRIVHGDEYRTVPEMLALVEAARPDLICTYRHLHGEGWKWPFTLGDHVEVLTQATQTPVLVLPHPDAGRAAEHALKNTNVVMAITDHLTGDNRLINNAIAFTERAGTLFLTHVEDSAIFERYIETIGKIPTLDTDVAREEIRKQLLKEPHDFIRSCRETLEQAGLSIHVEEIIRLGHRIDEYRALIADHEVDLLVFNTKDDEQFAMHGRAHPLAVELREIPLLML